jgi:hypothetical protein
MFLKNIYWWHQDVLPVNFIEDLFLFIKLIYILMIQIHKSHIILISMLVFIVLNIIENTFWNLFAHFSEPFT